MKSKFIFWSVFSIGIMHAEKTNGENSFAKALSRGLEHSKAKHITKNSNESKSKPFDVIAWTDDLTDDETG